MSSYATQNRIHVSVYLRGNVSFAYKVGAYSATRPEGYRYLEGEKKRKRGLRDEEAPLGVNRKVPIFAPPTYWHCVKVKGYIMATVLV